MMNPELHSKAVDAAKPFLPTDSKMIEKLRFFLKQKGPENFEAELQKLMK